MPDPTWPPSTHIPTKIGPSFTRERVLELLDSVLGKKHETGPSIIDELFNRPPQSPDYTAMGKNNSPLEMATMNAIQRWPNAASQAGEIYSGVPLFPGIGGTHTKGMFNLDPNIRLAPSWGEKNSEKFTYPEAYGNVVHELSHAQGLGDWDSSPNAYDMGRLGQALAENYYGKDINLPHEQYRPQPPSPPTRGRGIGPSFAKPALW